MKKIITMFLALSISFMVSGCQKSVDTIYTTVYPVEYLVERIVGNKYEVETISTGKTIQNATFIKTKVSKMDKEDLLFYINELEPYDDALQAYFDGQKVTASDISLFSQSLDFKRYATIQDPLSKEKQTVKNDYYDYSKLSKSDKYNHDPFLWIDPSSTISMSKTILDTMTYLDPVNKDVYKTNYDSLILELSKLELDYQKLNKESQKKLITITNSFGYLQNYNINVFPVILSKYDVMPSQSDLDYLVKVFKDNDIKYIAREPYFSDAQQKTYDYLVKTLNLKPINLSNISIYSELDKKNNANLLTIMNDNYIQLSLME